jgi:hypothetical protein
MSLANDLEISLLEHIFSISGAWTQPTIEVALWIGDPGEDGSGGAEVSGVDYARVAHAVWARSGNVVDNTGAITFTVAGGAWGTIDYFALFDSVSGDMLGSGALTVAKTVGEGDTVSFADGALNFTLD